MKSLFFRFALLMGLIVGIDCAMPAQAQNAYYVKPTNAPTALVQDYNVTIGVWMVPTAVGYLVGEFELQPDGKWLMGTTLTSGTFTLDADLNAAGGPFGWVQGQVPAINTSLKQRFPPIPGSGGGGGSGNASVDAINQMLANGYTLKYVNGVEVISLK